MAITQTGSSRKFSGMGLANAGTFATDIVVPSDATKAILIYSAFDDQNNGFTVATLTKGGVDTAMTKGAGTDFDQSGWQGAMFYLDDPDTGSGKTAKWDWAGTGDIVEHPCALLFFYKGTAAGIRDGDGGKQPVPPATTPWVCPTLTAQSGDLIVVGVSAFTTGVNTPGNCTGVSGWTVIENVSSDQHAGISRGEASPTGNHNMNVTASTGYDDGGIMGLVLTPAEAVVVTEDPMTKRLLFIGRR